MTNIYQPPSDGRIKLGFSPNYIAPNGSNIAIKFGAVSDVVVEDRYLFPVGFDGAVVGHSRTELQYERLDAKGFNQSAYGAATVINRAMAIHAKSITPEQFNKPTIYNIDTYAKLTGINSGVYGKPFVQGGVKHSKPAGFDASAFTKPLVINTKAEQYAKPKGIDAPAVERPTVRPYIAHPKGIYSQAFGVQHRIGFIPTLKPDGLSHTKWGNTTIWDHTRPLGVKGYNAFESGYAKIFDPMRRLHIPSLITSAIFGDTALKNTTAFINTSGIDDLVVTPWSVVTNSNRYYSPNGIDSQAFGDNSIRNKTPSIFVDSIKPHGIGAAAIGYAIRKIGVTGFDRLLLGKPLLTKTPELLPKTFSSSRVPNLAFISHSIRYLLPIGHNSNKYGEHTLWFRYRYVEPQSWQSSKFGRASLTHGVRELIASGFIRQGYGNAWVSHGTRQLAPIGINKTHPTRHLVGGTQHLNPVGYVATLFGTRITPESRNVYPLGFVGKWGLSSIELYTRYLKPQGYISFGAQPADRWGWALAYNSVQFITQQYDSGNGLVPPKWSEWTAIENRNKQIGATGLNSLRFGYNKIDNNARQLLPKGVHPKAIAGGMIAQARRPIALNGIEPPMIGTWSVVFNAARVIEPISATHTATGQLATVVNNRRYYRGYGRIDSLVMDAPAISHRIRGIDIERRYSIAPPQINLPTIDLLTKYIEPQGYSSEVYGTPVFDIRFNIIAPKWVHRDSIGEGYVRNLTPEIGAYGHNSDLFGFNTIRTQWRKVYAVGNTLSVFGLSKISDTKRTIVVAGWRDTVVSQKHTVTRMGAPLYSEQKISLDGWFDYATDKYREGDGINSEKTVSGSGSLRVPKPSINQNVLYTEGYVASLWGDNRVWSNNIMIDAGIAIHNISANNMVRHKNREIILTEEHAIKSKVELGKPRMSPWTIYAVVEAPKQARLNHEESPLGLHAIDGRRLGGSIAVFGTHRVDSTIRTVYQYKTLTSKPDLFGNAVLQLTRRIIAPPSFRRSGVGLPSIPFTLQTITMFDKSIPMSLYGLSSILQVNNGPALVSSIGSDGLIFGVDVDINHRDRLVKPIGYNALAMGSKKNNDKPYMWQGLRVGAHVPFVIGGGNMSAFGEGMVSLHIRGIELEGWESFISEYDTANFTERMKVTLVNKPLVFETQRITANGFVATDYSNADIKFGQYFIRPDGNSYQFRKGGYHA